MSVNSSSSSSQPSANKLKQRLTECFERGTHLMTADRNFDYAHTMFAECVVHEPANLIYAESLLQNLKLKFAGQRVKASLFGGGSRELKKALQQQQWKQCFRLGIEILKDDPWDIATLRALAQACAALHYNEVELAYLKQALEAKPKDIETNKHCARSLARMGQFDQAIACWHRIETNRPGDKEAARMIGELTEEKFKYAGGQPPVAAAQSTAAGESTSTGDESSSNPREIVLSARQLLERAIAEDPFDVANYLELADLLCDDQMFGEAEAVLTRGIAAVGDHSALVDRLQRVRTERAERELAAAEARRKAEERLKRKPIKIPWLELTLGIAAIALLFQFFPGLAATAWQLIDVRNWSRVTWFLVNFVAVALLCVYRYAPHLLRWRRKQME